MESPCVLICSIDDKTGWCHGCGRTMSEISSWSMYSDAQRREIMDLLPNRMGQIERKERRVTRRRQRSEASES